MFAANPMEPGTTLSNRYRIEKEIGRGGMAIVYRAFDEELRESVAVKILIPSLDQGHLAVERLRREAMAYSKLAHPNIVKLLNFVVEDHLAFLVMELVEGPDLKQKILLDGPLGVAQTVKLGSQIASALDAAHRQGVIHRDIKPQNVLLASEDQIKVVDFGLARLTNIGGLTATRTTMGTPEYMAPEQIQARPVDPRADIYSLGILLYECLSGRPPFSGSDPFRVFQDHLNGFATPLTELRPDLPAWLCNIVETCFRRRKEDRYRSAAGVVEALARTDHHDNMATMTGIYAPVAHQKEVCPRCGGPAPDLVGFCLHCGTSGDAEPNRVDEIVVRDRQRWERENQEILESLTQKLPSFLSQSLEDYVEKHQSTELEEIDHHAREVEKRRKELELPMADLTMVDQAVILLRGRRAGLRWRQNKKKIGVKLQPLKRWRRKATVIGFVAAMSRLPNWSRIGTAGGAIGASVLFFVDFGMSLGFLLTGTGFLATGIYVEEWKRGGPDPSECLEEALSEPGGVLGAQRLEKIRKLVDRRSRRIIEPMARLLSALAQTLHLVNEAPDTIGAVVGDVSGAVCELVDLALLFGNKAAGLEEYLGRERQEDLETEIQRIGHRLDKADIDSSGDLMRLKGKKEDLLLKRLDLDRQLEQMLTRLSLTATEAEDLLAAMYRLSLTQPANSGQPSMILASLKAQLQAMEELFPGDR